MSKYSDWLLVSDIDGTLLDKKRNIPTANKAAIRDYVDNGGKFTLCSGRNMRSLYNHYKSLGIHTPAIILNGAGIYDFKTNSLIHYSPISQKGEGVLLSLIDQFKTAQLTVFDEDTVYMYTRKCAYGFIVSVLDKLPRKLCLDKSSLPSGRWGKVTFFATPGVLRKISAILNNEENSQLFECFFTSPVSLEVVNKNVNKGYAVGILSEILNINPENVGAIGDYYNDEPMLRSVAHPVCCGQAPDDLKSLCEYITCHCNDGAVNDFINYIENNYIKRR